MRIFLYTTHTAIQDTLQYGIAFNVLFAPIQRQMLMDLAWNWDFVRAAICEIVLINST